MDHLSRLPQLSQRRSPLSQLSRAFWWLVRWSLTLGFLAACFRNVFWDSPMAIAEEAACGGRRGCSAFMTEGLRTPVGHSYRFSVAGRQVEVVCRRAYLLEGEYTCKDKALDAMSVPVTSAPTSAPAPARSASTARK